MKVFSADYVIVGGGTAGCVLAARLSEDPNVSVLVLEAGPHYRGLPIRIPAALGGLYEKGRYHWPYKSQPEHFAGNRVSPFKMGRVVGGSSAINGLVWVRGNAKDYDDWEAAGCRGWGFEDLEPLFRRIESFVGPSDGQMGQSGPIPVMPGRPEKQPLSDAFLKAAAQAGEGHTDNYNGLRQDGFCALQRNTRAGRRGDVYQGYIEPVKARRNLTILPNQTVQRILVEQKRAVGVEVVEHGTARKIRANREVLLCAGAIASPQLLEVSGIGNRDILSRAHIETIHELPGVGENLHTHPAVTLCYTTTRPISILKATRGVGKFVAGVRWLLTRSGPAATNHFEAGAFIRARPGIDRPDCFLVFLPLALSGTTGTTEDHGFQVYIDLLGCKSRGSSHVTVGDIVTQPAFSFNFLEDDRDVEAFRLAIATVRKVVGQPAFEDIVGQEIRPGPKVLGVEPLEDWIRNNTSFSHHLVGTCRMGPREDSRAVVGPDLKVHGLDGLRVVDASIMPTIPSGNTHAAAIVIGEKGADLIRYGHVSERETPII